MRVSVLHEEIAADAALDSVDTQVQVNAVMQALRASGYECEETIFSLDAPEMVECLKQHQPQVVFNLVESVFGQNRLMHIAADYLDANGFCHTGVSGLTLHVTTDKLFAKHLMTAFGIPTPAWQAITAETTAVSAAHLPLIIKPYTEDASTGIDDSCLCRTPEAFAAKMTAIQAEKRRQYLAESYIEGREFNVSMIGVNGQPVVLPLAEMCFVDYPPEKPRIVNYAAKWDPSSFEFHKTVRRFDFPAEDQPLLQAITGVCQQCWRSFHLSGYVRVDLRVDKDNKPFVLEINGNPCIAPDSGFAAAAGQAGYSYERFIAMIVTDALDRYPGKVF